MNMKAQSMVPSLRMFEFQTWQHGFQVKVHNKIICHEWHRQHHHQHHYQHHSQHHCQHHCQHHHQHHTLSLLSIHF